MRNLSACLALLAITSVAEAEGELGPMIGGGVIASRGDDTEVAGIGAELVLWYGRLGVAVEGSRQWSVDDVNGPRVGSVAGSVRVLAFDHIVPSLLDSREVVELGIELQGIVEHAWWDAAPTRSDPVSYGFGVALRLRGANDDDRSTTMLAESRLFVRAMRSRDDEDMNIARRDTSPTTARGGMSVIVGLGAMFGGGKPAYVDKLRRRNALDSEYLVR